jgi:hypothetical protein
LANIGDGESAKEYIMANEDVLKKLTDYMVCSVMAYFCVIALSNNALLWCNGPYCKTCDPRVFL